MAFPDIDGYDEWQRKLTEYPELAVTISPVLQQNSTKEDRDAQYRRIRREDDFSF